MPTFTLPNLPTGLDFSKLDLSKVQLPKFNVPKFNVPKINWPKIDLRKIDLTKVDVPKVDLPGVDVDRLSDLARDAAYAGVGLVVLTVEKIAERGRGLQAEATTRLVSWPTPSPDSRIASHHARPAGAPDTLVVLVTPAADPVSAALHSPRAPFPSASRC